ncbi:MAG: VOC family protein [Planctomycetota bacterium]
MTQRAFPYLYADAPAAIDFLSNAFGFEPGMRFDVDDGRVGHAELHCQGSTRALASVWPDMGFASPRDLPAVRTQIKFQVDDVDAHYARARERGATVALGTRGPATSGSTARSTSRGTAGSSDGRQLIRA